MYSIYYLHFFYLSYCKLGKSVFFLRDEKVAMFVYFTGLKVSFSYCYRSIYIKYIMKYMYDVLSQSSYSNLSAYDRPSCQLQRANYRNLTV